MRQLVVHHRIDGHVLSYRCSECQRLFEALDYPTAEELEADFRMHKCDRSRGVFWKP